MKLIQVQNVNEKSELRKKYLDSLIEPQEYFLEQFMKDAAIYKFLYNHELAGYCIINEENTILEFYLEKEYIAKKEVIFRHVIKELAIQSAYCKSFDHLFLNICMQYFQFHCIHGFLFRDYSDSCYKEKNAIHDIHARKCLASDVADILSINDGFFSGKDEIEHYVDNNNLILFEKNGSLIGCGLYQRVIDDKDDFDIGMLVDPKFRKLGYGSYILNYMKELCIKSNFRPICGCGFENAASRKCIENAGFINLHILAKFSFK
ncbi:MAG: GNAT family N-acetyltransferase [Clostridia bacterium]|nr:GNAT family N-acetyltransferase [Clostridia bacterium]